MTAKTPTQRVAKMRADREKQGVKRLELYAHDEDIKTIKAYAAKLSERRARAEKRAKE
jgi:hypothetical protein